MSVNLEVPVSRVAANERKLRLVSADGLLIRRSRDDDHAMLERLAALDSQELPAGTFLLALESGELVAALPLDVDAKPLADPFRPTAAIVRLLDLQVRRWRVAGMRDSTVRAAA